MQAPLTPESERHITHSTDRLQRLQMTDPDQCHSRNRLTSSISSIPQPNFAAAGPFRLYQPAFGASQRRSLLPTGNINNHNSLGSGPVMLPDVSDDPFGIDDINSGSNNNNLGLLDPSGIDENTSLPNTIPIVPNPGVLDPSGSNEGTAHPQIIHVDSMPQVQLPPGWDAPLQNPIPTVVPPAPPQVRRGRHRCLSGPLHNISSGQANPALNNLHCGHIAHREQVANHQADRQAYLLAQLQQLQREKEQQEQQVRNDNLVMQAALQREQENQRTTAQEEAAQRQQQIPAEPLDQQNPNIHLEEEQQRLAQLDMDEDCQRRNAEAMQRMMRLHQQEQIPAEQVHQQDANANSHLEQEQQRLAQLDMDEDCQRHNAEAMQRMMRLWQQEWQADLEQEDEDDQLQ